ncbi:hypothetical protein ABT56_09820 [Photobacterium aquae]|uniref:Sulfatase N-terminal domain-containing protein n=1 Tax=Photobacterium aquae TaxID=1195763 RepID=A0A0J1H1W7_9GAMM|nr:sulfatase-like hydrolase/transferase [Photobacterium aquae]KLV05829.1 hypothetical protein ABT56_09820 [Photobacterium aquae]
MPFKLSFFVVSLFLLCACQEQENPSSRATAKTQIENIIIIYADDLGFGQVGAYGQQLIQTPRMDDLATRGIRFTQFYSSAAYCPPARNSLLTGLHTGESNWKNPVDMFGEEETIADVLKARGYDTSIFGKWGMSHADDSAAQFIRDTYPLCSNMTQDDMIRKLPEEFINGPADAGFTTFVGFMQHRDAHVHYHDSPQTPEESTPYHPYYEGVRQDLFQLIGDEVKRYKTTPDQYLPDVIMDEAIAHLRTVKDNKFFMLISSTLPHAELVSHPDTKKLYQQNGKSIFPETPWTGNHIFFRHVDEPRAELAGMITRLDQHVGMVIDELEALGIADKTLVIISSDNGAHLAGGMNDFEFFRSSGELRDGKWTIYEGGIRVPTIMYYNGIRAGVEETPFAQYQLKDTILELATGEPLNRSIVPVLDRERVEPLPHLYWQHHYDKSEEPLYEKAHTLQAVRQGDWKLVRLEPTPDTTTWAVYGNNSVKLELYNLREDAGETQDRHQEHCDITLALVDILNIYATADNKIAPIENFQCNQQ